MTFPYRKAYTARTREEPVFSPEKSMEDQPILTETEDRDPENYNAYLKVRINFR